MRGHAGRRAARHRTHEPGRGPTPAAQPQAPRGWAARSEALAAVLALGFALVAYGPALTIPFLGDDYVFLDKTRAASFGELWSFANTNFGWYRPWSRELHFWTIQHLAGANEVAFRAVSLLLWLAGLAMYGRLVRGFAGARAAWIATLGAAAMALWSAPLLWISGSQDLWMVALAMLALLLVSRGRDLAALGAYALALLSKETAVVVPVLVAGYSWLVSGERWPRLARRVAPFLAVTLVWFLVHPVLRHRLTTHAATASFGAEPHPPALEIALRSLASVVNASTLGSAVDWGAFQPWRTALATALLVGAAALALRIGAPRANAKPPAPGAAVARAEGTPAADGRALRFGALWAAAGWAPLFQSSIGWHAYYGCLGAMGAWVALGAWLERRPRWVLPAFAAIGVMLGVSGATRSWDWGSEWYQRRAGNLLGLIRRQLRESHPTLPHHARVYFGNIPNNIGLVAGQSPAVRVWYGDSTLQAGFYSYYEQRRAEEPRGEDLFFHFDTTSGLSEVRTGPEDLASALRANPAWEADHRSLAVLFVEHRNFPAAAVEFEKIARLPDRPDALMFAAVSREQNGERAYADSLFRLASQRSGRPPAEIAAWAAQLRATLPTSR